MTYRGSQRMRELDNAKRGDRIGSYPPGSLVHCAGCGAMVPELIAQGDGRFRCQSCDGRPDGEVILQK